MIFAKICYKIQDTVLLAIVEIFKNWDHNLKICKNKILGQIDYENLYQFIDLKSLSFCYVF